MRTVDDQDLLGGLFLAESVQDQVDGLAEDHAVGTNLLGGSLEDLWGGVGLDVVQDVAGHFIGVSAGFEVVQGSLDGRRVVSVGRSLQISDTGCHQALGDD